MSACQKSLGVSQPAPTASMPTATTGRAAERVESADRPDLRWIEPLLSRPDYIKSLNETSSESMESLDNSDVSGRRWYGTTQAARKNKGETFQDEAIREASEAVIEPLQCHESPGEPTAGQAGQSLKHRKQKLLTTLRPNSNGT